MKCEGTLIMEHKCKKWKKGMKEPKIITKKKSFGLQVCSLCGEPFGGRLSFSPIGRN